MMAETFPKIDAYMREPINIIMTEQIFSLFVFGDTFPNRTDVKEEKVK